MNMRIRLKNQGQCVALRRRPKPIESIFWMRSHLLEAMTCLLSACRPCHLDQQVGALYHETCLATRTLWPYRDASLRLNRLATPPFSRTKRRDRMWRNLLMGTRRQTVSRTVFPHPATIARTKRKASQTHSTSILPTSMSPNERRLEVATTEVSHKVWHEAHPKRHLHISLT